MLYFTWVVELKVGQQTEWIVQVAKEKRRKVHICEVWQPAAAPDTQMNCWNLVPHETQMIDNLWSFLGQSIVKNVGNNLGRKNTRIYWRKWHKSFWQNKQGVLCCTWRGTDDQDKQNTIRRKMTVAAVQQNFRCNKGDMSSSKFKGDPRFDQMKSHTLPSRHDVYWEWWRW